MQPIEPTNERMRVVLDVLVVPRQYAPEVCMLRMVDRLDDEAVVAREVEERAGFACSRQREYVSAGALESGSSMAGMGWRVGSDGFSRGRHVQTQSAIRNLRTCPTIHRSAHTIPIGRSQFRRHETNRLPDEDNGCPSPARSTYTRIPAAFQEYAADDKRK